MRRLLGACSGSLLILTFLLSGCGGDADDDGASVDPPDAGTASASAEPTTAAAAPTEAEADATVQAYFDAMRAADTATICALESEALKTLKYDDPAACADDLANQTEQMVWAEDIPVVEAAVSEGTGYLTVRPNAGDDVTEALVTLRAVDGAWQVDALQ